jgi:hypothetical protein
VAPALRCGPATAQLRADEETNMDKGRSKKVLCPIEKKDGKTFWFRIGIAYTNADGSTNLYLDALPATPKLQIRDFDERDAARRGGDVAVDSQLPF